MICQLYLTLAWLQGEGEHKRVKQFYPRVRKGDHVRGIARHIYRERTLFQTQQAFKKKRLDDNQYKLEDDTITLNIPFTEVEVLGPTPPEQHHHISKDVDELVSRYTVQCTTQKQNKTPRVYKARQYTRCTCKMSSATSCSVRVSRGSYVNQERVTEKACLRALYREMMED